LKVLLAKPFTEKLRRIYSVPPLGLGYLATALRKEHDVEILDCEVRNYGESEFAAHLARSRPDVVGFTVFSHNKRFAARAIEVTRVVRPDAWIVAGGPHVSAVRDQALRDLPGLDAAFVGEAERSLPAWIEARSEGTDTPHEGIPGLVWRDGNEVRYNPPVFDDDISAFDPVSYDLMDLDIYFRGNPHGIFTRSNRVVPLITSRGCPYPCTFCAASQNSGHKVRYRELARVLEEIDRLVHRYGVREIHIEDDNFTFDRDYVLAFCEGIARLPFRVALALPNGVRADRIDEEMLAAMRRAGFYAISFGIESGSDETLRRIRKLETTAQMRSHVEMAHRAGFRVTGFFMIGFPWETREDILQTLSYARSLPLDHASFGNFSPLPGTEITRLLVADGQLAADAEVGFVWGGVGYAPDSMSPGDLQRLQRRCTIGFYLPWKIFKVLPDIRPSNATTVLKRAAMLFRVQVGGSGSP
jgi:anaerobic magnesium-protoporphyrin IX monomethyl ester cyclase